MVSTRRTPSRLETLPQGLTLVTKAPLQSVPSKRALRPRSLNYDISEPEPASDASTSDNISWTSSPPPSPKKRTTRSSGSRQKNGSTGFDEATPLPKSRSMILSVQEAASPVRKRLRAIENIQAKSGISKSRSVPQTLSKNLTSLCDKLVVQETPKQKPLPYKSSSGFSNVFAHARHLLKLSSTDVISSEHFLGRSKELLKLKKFLVDRYENFPNSRPTGADSSSPSNLSPSGSLYISGPPGTGKTHMIKSVLLNDDHEVARALKNVGVKVHFINCVALSTSTGATGLSSGTGLNALDEQLWNHVAASLGISRPASVTSKHLTSRALVEKHVMDNKVTPSIIILDEIDYLAASKLPLITPLLALSQRSPNANFTVIGIANTLDLTTRLVKPLPSSTNDTQIEPELIHFTSFESSDLVDIAKQRLRHLYTSYAHSTGPDWPVSTPQKLFACSSSDVSTDQDANSIPLFHPAALQLCAKKVAAVTGDLRTFLSILRKLVESLEQNAIRNSQFLEQSSGSQKSVLDTPTKMRKFTRIISTSQLAPDLAGPENDWAKTKIIDPCTHFTPNTAPKISPSDVVKYLKTSGILDSPTFNTSQAECVKKLQDLNLHQSLVLVCLCVAWSREQDETHNTGCGVGRSQAYEIYRNCLKPTDGYNSRNTFNIGINPVSESEWADLLESGLQTRGLVSCPNERVGPSRPSTPSTSHSNNNLGPSPFKSPSKRKQMAFQRSALCTPTKLKPIGFNSPHSIHRPSPTKTSTNDRNSGQALLEPVHSISILIQAIQSLANRTEEVPSDDAPRFSPEIISILNQLLITEEKRSRVDKKRKAVHIEDVNTIGRKATFARLDDDDVDQENLVKGRMLTIDDEGSCRD
ncbi:hypothetical protein Pst134EA_030266 [Puccinia striiformis f. sp. tritici]|nr:hypothetical protein Pst134EA_030266 [Puccinia striiformis f. sp. tritici]KAH9446345.1 hypothetical protein Pst134EA_030266 [Puccinia striiformis f. sp. tritici]